MQEIISPSKIRKKDHLRRKKRQCTRLLIHHSRGISAFDITHSWSNTLALFLHQQIHPASTFQFEDPIPLVSKTNRQYKAQDPMFKYYVQGKIILKVINVGGFKSWGNSLRQRYLLCGIFSSSGSANAKSFIIPWTENYVYFFCGYKVFQCRIKLSVCRVNGQSG